MSSRNVSYRTKKYEASRHAKRSAANSARRVTSSALANERTMSALVKRVMNKASEKKIHQNTAESLELVPYGAGAAFATGNVWEMGPSTGVPLAQGTGSSDRIGNKIRVVKATMRVIIFPKPYDATTNPAPRPQDVRLIVLHSKNNPTDVVVSNTFFEQNNSTTSPQDDLVDMLHPVNRDDYVVSSDRHYKVGVSSADGTGAIADAQSFTNNDYKYNQIITQDVTHAFPSVITFNDTSSVPTSFQPTLVALTCKADGTTTNSNHVPLEMWCNCQLEYTDM